MKWGIQVLGWLIVFWTLREVFADLFQPSDSGDLSSWIGKILFGLGRRWKAFLPIVGPLTIVTAMGCWAALIALGFALVYWPRYPASFQTTTPEAHYPQAFLSACYFSLVSLTTLAGGTLSPNTIGLRLTSAVESLIGVSLVTASVTWIVVIYPALGRMRSLARLASTMQRAEDLTEIRPLSAGGSALLLSIGERIIQARIDFIHFPLIYYFHADTEGASLAHAMLRLLDLAKEGCDLSNSKDVRYSAALLLTSMDDLADVIAARFLPGRDFHKPEEVFQAAANDHLRHDASDASAES